MKSYAKIITAMLIWGTLPVFVSKIPYSSAEIVMWRTLIGFLFLGCVFLVSRRKKTVQPFICSFKKYAFRLILSGMFMGANWVALFESYRWVDVSIATLAYYMSPVIVMIASVFLFREHAGKIKILGMTAAVAGMFIVTGVQMGGLSPVKGVFLGLAAAVCYSLVTLINKSTTGIGGLEMTLIQLIGALLIAVPYTVLTHEGAWMDFTSQAGLFTLILGFVHAGGALFLYFSAIQELPAQSVALCSYIDPASALFFAAIFLGDSLTPVQLLGAAMILGGAAAGEVFSRADRRV